MRPTTHVLRDDDRYLVIVGWDNDLETFYAYAHDRTDGSAEHEPALSIGVEAHELPTISALITAVSRFAPLSPSTISSLRHEASPLADGAAPYESLPEAS